VRLKALSFRQPWAELILRGEITIALRTWSTEYRGPLAVYAPKRVEVEACERVGIARGALATGALVGLVDLVDVECLDEESYEQQADEHLRRRAYQKGIYGWHLQAPRRLRAPWPVAGMKQLFEVEIPDGLIAKETVIPLPEDQVSAAPFELYVVPDGRGGSGYGLALYQRGIEPEQRRLLLYLPGPGEDTAKVGELSPEKARMAAGPVLQALREADYRATDLAAGRRDPFLIGEETGVRLGLIFQAIGPVSKVARIEGIVAGLAAMPAEEAYYWYSKCAGGGKAQRARRALRILLSDED
jgi:hypothetical protein